jgi:hypothetical protein
MLIQILKIFCLIFYCNEYSRTTTKHILKTLKPKFESKFSDCPLLENVLAVPMTPPKSNYDRYPDWRFFFCSSAQSFQTNDRE